METYGTARQATYDNIIRRMRFACRITKATDTHTEYVIPIPFPRQKWLRERALILRYTYVTYLSRYAFSLLVFLLFSFSPASTVESFISYFH